MQAEKMIWQSDEIFAPRARMPAGLHAGSELVGNPRTPAEGPHFLGGLILASFVGAVACTVALLSGLSLWAGLGIYSAVGCAVFASVLGATAAKGRASAVRFMR